MKFKTWKGEDLKGLWAVSTKIDGVRAHRVNEGWVSRTGKKLYNLPDVSLEVCEVYLGSFKETISAVKTHKGNLIPKEYLYSLNPIDSRLLKYIGEDLSKDFILSLFNNTVKQGYEGLVLRQGDTLLKVKPIETYDVEVTGKGEGKGKFEDMLGYLETRMGKVGTGFTNEERRVFWKEPPKIIEVSCLEITEDGKFRHPRFIRERWDKS